MLLSKKATFLFITLNSLSFHNLYSDPMQDERICEITTQILDPLHDNFDLSKYFHMIHELNHQIADLKQYSTDERVDLVIKIASKVLDKTDSKWLWDPLSDRALKALIHPIIILNNWIDEGSFIFDDPSFVRAMTIEKLEEYIKLTFKDGFQIHDLMTILKLCYNFVLGFPELPEKEQKNIIRSILDTIIDWTDTPYLPDIIFDPIFKMILTALIDELYVLIHHDV